MIGTVVVGAGLSGLVRAYSLARRREEVLLLEASGRPGGVVQTERRDGFLLELGPNTVRPTREIWRLVEELRLAGSALLADPKAPRYLDFGGHLHPLPTSPPALLRSRLLSGRGKLRLLAEPFVPRGRGPVESVRDFFARRLGREVAERVIEPFVGGIFAGDCSQLSIAECLPAIARAEREHGSLLRSALADLRRRETKPPAPRGLLSFREGLATLPRALAERLGDRLRLETPAREISPHRGFWKVRTPRGEIEAERLVLATPAPEAARLVERFDSGAASSLSDIPHPPLAVLHLSCSTSAFPRPLDGFGHLVVPQSERRILGAVWSSSLFPDRSPEGQALLTVFLGGSRDPEVVALSDRDLVEPASRDLRAALGATEDFPVLAVTRYPRALPQYDFGHAARLRVLSEAEARWPGLTFLGNYRGGVSVGDVVRSAVV